MNFLPWHKSESEREKIINAELRQRRREIVEVMQENAELRNHIDELESKHVLWEDYKLVRNLRHFADRVLVCWEGSDADEAAETMNRAADLLDGDAQIEYDNSSEMQELLERAANSDTVIRNNMEDN